MQHPCNSNPCNNPVMGERDFLRQPSSHEDEARVVTATSLLGGPGIRYGAHTPGGLSFPGLATCPL